jgi:UDP-N-acetylmuramoyl-tripeptide--D-alanyl-D-alanine ligase
VKRIEVRKVFDGIINFICEDEVAVDKISIDSRNVKRGDIFFGLKGNRTDGNLYAFDAIEKGAQLVVLDNKDVYDKISLNKVLVKDSLDALKSLGQYYINRYRGKIICITGSVGKTTTKSILSSILSNSYKTYESYKNYNNELGVAISACNLDMSSKYAVFEAGTNSSGEINLLTNYLIPDLGIITSIGYSHIGRFGGHDNLAKEKMSLTNSPNMEKVWIDASHSKYANLARRGVKIRYFGNNKNADIFVSDINRADEHIDFTAVYKGQSFNFRINHIYEHFVYNCLPCIAVAMDEGVEIEAIKDALANFKPVEKRGQILKVDSLKIIDDTYNAGFQSVISSIENLSKVASENKMAVVGKMAEIEGFEDELYEKLKQTIEESKDIKFVLCGEIFEKFSNIPNVEVVEDKGGAFEKIKSFREGIILFKASRGEKFEELVNAVMSSGAGNVL